MEEERDFITLTLKEFVSTYMKYRGKSIKLYDCPVLLTKKVVTDHYYIALGPVSGGSIRFHTHLNDGSVQYNQSIRISDYSIFDSRLEEGLICERHDYRFPVVVLPILDKLTKKLQEFRVSATKSKETHKKQYESVVGKIAQLEHVIKEHPELLI